MIVLESEDQYEACMKESKDGRPVFVYYTAAWCKPCKEIKPVYAKLAEQHEDALFLSVDVDDFEDIAEDSGGSLPAFHRTKNGDSVESFSGNQKDKLEKLIANKYK